MVCLNHTLKQDFGNFYCPHCHTLDLTTVINSLSLASIKENIVHDKIPRIDGKLWNVRSAVTWQHCKNFGYSKLIKVNRMLIRYHSVDHDLDPMTHMMSMQQKIFDWSINFDQPMLVHWCKLKFLNGSRKMD